MAGTDFAQFVITVTDVCDDDDDDDIEVGNDADFDEAADRELNRRETLKALVSARNTQVERRQAARAYKRRTSPRKPPLHYYVYCHVEWSEGDDWLEAPSIRQTEDEAVDYATLMCYKLGASHKIVIMRRGKRRFFCWEEPRVGDIMCDVMGPTVCDTDGSWPSAVAINISDLDDDDDDDDDRAKETQQ